ncbi:DUF421 domain-containing protein [Oceanirhabdus sp. W0125-5]|uniref:DUF421 domain-containing protein n=1 Tax=Oceanirhabdus sp. W0125-5 TaxID=2999116 RepID=UPI0022F31211|nr:DUF421 domain-containing protein [Oceanirhabdus sp. W0125-5]WBW98781.1 DUF421 domain-containing protein [Oceanirhabdus sp. W0125-5]
MFVLIIRTIILYFFTLVIIRLTGKRQLGQLQPFELVITVMISQLATIPMQDIRIPLIHIIGPIITLLFLQVITMFLSLKSEYARKYICGKPSVLIEQGKIQIDQMEYQKVNLNDLLEELRLKGFYNIEDIEYAILETSGELSIIPVTSRTVVTKADLNIRSSQDKLPVTLILDGKINHNNLKVIDKDIHWLEEQLIRHKILDYKKVFFAIYDSRGKFFYQLRS